MKQLSEDSLKAFNTDYIRDHVGWGEIKKMIDHYFPGGKFHFLDVGGGNGLFADQLLNMYPKAHGTIIDNSEYLLNKNTPHERKTIILCSVEDMDAHFQNQKFDLITFNWVLHHFVEDSYKRSLMSISKALRSGRDLLAKDGKISILENAYLPYFSETLPSRIIYHTLSSRLISVFAKWRGINTLGVGVCYLSEKLWCALLKKIDLDILKCKPTASLRTKPLNNLFCCIRGIEVVQIVTGKVSF